MKVRQSFLHKPFLWLLVLFIMLPQASFGAGKEYTLSDISTPIKYEGSSTYISGPHMVWLGRDAQGERQVFYEDLSTGEKKQLTSVPSAKDDVRAGQLSNGDPVVLWVDKRNYNELAMRWDVYAMNLRTKEETKLNDSVGQLTAPSFDGGYACWYNLDGNEMYLYDFSTGQREMIGNGRYPVLKGGRILYQNAEDGGMSLYEIGTKTSAPVVNVPRGDYVVKYAFNGKNALWVENNKDGNRYRTADLTASSITPKDLTGYLPVVYTGLSVGDTYGAWVQEVNGVRQMIGVDLQNGKTEQLTTGTVDQRQVLFVGDRLVLKGSDGNQIYRSIIRTADQRSGTSPVLTLHGGSTTLGVEGGELASDDGKAIVSMPAGGLGTKSEVSVEMDKGEYKLPSQMRFVSPVWTLSTEQPFLASAQLRLAFDGRQIIPQQLKKLAMYRYDDIHKVWNYIGGVSDSGTNTVAAAITRAGHYAVTLYEPAFRDIRGHWAQQAIEITASRQIVSGMKPDQFGPNAVLTRGQFARMLVSAIGLDPSHAEKASFTDVSSSHWSYPWVEAAAKAGLVNGSGGRFEPDQPLTREQMMTMLIKAIGEEDAAKALNEQELQTLLPYKDANKIDKWAISYAALAVKYEFVKGNQGALLPDRTSTRAEAAAVILKLLLYSNKI